MQTVKLGNTGIKTSRLAIGTGSNGWNGRSNQTDLGYQELVDLFHFAYRQGIKFWDLADMYGSHPHAKGALRGLDRDKNQQQPPRPIKAKPHLGNSNSSMVDHW